ncbi:hypothetical protein T484DRAFT_2022867, partial [Baffinella frigidus]
MLGSASASRPEERESQLEKPGGALPNGLSVLPYDLPLSTTAGPHKNEGAGVLEITSELRARAVSAEQRAARLEEALKESRAERERLVENVRDLTENLENERLMTQLAQEESRVSTEAVRQERAGFFKEAARRHRDSDAPEVPLKLNLGSRQASLPHKSHISSGAPGVHQRHSSLPSNSKSMPANASHQPALPAHRSAPRPAPPSKTPGTGMLGSVSAPRFNRVHPSNTGPISVPAAAGEAREAKQPDPSGGARQPPRSHSKEPDVALPVALQRVAGEPVGGGEAHGGAVEREALLRQLWSGKESG